MAPHPSGARSSSSRDRLLQAAKRLFAAQGYEQTATSAIAREAGTSESQLMRYFGGKVGLLEALFDEAWKDVHERVKKVTAADAGGRDMILEVLQTLTTSFARDPDLAVLFLFEGRRLRGEELRIRMPRGFVAFFDLVRNLIRRAQSARELDATLDPNAATSAVVGAAEAMIRDRVLARVTGGRAYSEKEIRRTLDAMLSGLGRSRTSTPRTSARRIR